MENPEDRQFDFDRRGEARAQWLQLLAAGLTIIRTYLAEGRSNPMPKLGSFEHWNLVREALVWLGCADPILTRVRVVTEDPRKEALRAVLRLRREAVGNIANYPDPEGETFARHERAWYDSDGAEQTYWYRVRKVVRRQLSAGR